jgi:hypothetical protein
MSNNKNFNHKNNILLTTKSVENESEEEDISEEDKNLYKLINKFKNSNGI